MSFDFSTPSSRWLRPTLIAALTYPAARATASTLGFSAPRRLVQVVGVSESPVNPDVRLTFSDGLFTIAALPTAECLNALVVAAGAEVPSDLIGATLRVDAASLSSMRGPATKLTGWKPGPRQPVLLVTCLAFIGGLGNLVYGNPTPLDQDGAVKTMLLALVATPHLLASLAPPLENDNAFVYLGRGKTLGLQLTPGALAVPVDQRIGVGGGGAGAGGGILGSQLPPLTPMIAAISPVPGFHPNAGGTGGGVQNFHATGFTTTAAVAVAAAAAAAAVTTAAAAVTAAGSGSGGDGGGGGTAGQSPSLPAETSVTPTTGGVQRPVFTPGSPTTPPAAAGTSPTASAKSVIAAQSTASAIAHATAARASLAQVKILKEQADASAAAVVAVALSTPRPQVVSPASQMSSPFQEKNNSSSTTSTTLGPSSTKRLRIDYSSSSSKNGEEVIFPHLWLFSFAAAAASGPLKRTIGQ